MSDPSLARKSARELASLIRTGAVSPVEVLDAHLDVIGRINPKLNAIVTLAEDSARAAARAAEAAVRRGEPVGPLLWPADRHQGRDADGRHPHHVRFAALQGQCPGRGCRSRPPSQGRRRHRAGQDQHAGIRDRRQHRQPGVRRDAQSVESGAEPGRLVGRFGGGGRDRHAAAGAGHRLRLLDPHSGRVLRHRRHPADARADAELSDAARLGLRPGARPAGAHRRRRRVDARFDDRPEPVVADVGRAAVVQRARRGRADRRLQGPAGRLRVRYCRHRRRRRDRRDLSARRAPPGRNGRGRRAGVVRRVRWPRSLSDVARRLDGRPAVRPAVAARGLRPEPEGQRRRPG